MFKSAHAKVAAFRKTRGRQSNDDFLREVGASNDAHASHVALAVRRAVATAGLVDPLYIRADDRADNDLAVLPLWDSMDWVELVMNIEDELGVTITDEDAMSIRVNHFSVRSCIEDVTAILQRTGHNGDGPCPSIMT